MFFGAGRASHRRKEGFSPCGRRGPRRTLRKKWVGQLSCRGPAISTESGDRSCGIEGRVEGEVEVGSLVVDEGGTLQGTCTRRGVTNPATGKGKTDEHRLIERPGISSVNGLPIGNESLYVKAFDKKP